MNEGQSFDTVWEDKYSSGHGQRYPWDSVVSFVFRNAPRDKPHSEVRILEVGCGTAGNLWFAAREGFDVAGIDGSKSAIDTARARFDEESLTADLRVADFTELPFEDRSFDLVIDRGALTCCGYDNMRKAIAEIARVCVQGGKFLFTPYADSHSSYQGGTLQADGTTTDITQGALAGLGQIYFVSHRQIADLLAGDWNILQCVRREDTEFTDTGTWIHAEWRVVAVRS